MIAVTFALPNESRDFRRLLGDRAGDVAILHTGVGKKSCREHLGPFLDSQSFDFLISSGFAGGVADSLEAGDLFLAENYSDPDLLARARALLLAQTGRLLTIDQVVDHTAQRAKLAREHGADAVDMETEWIAQACAAKKVPLLSLRVISDTSAAPFPAPPDVLFDLERQRTNPWRLGRHLLTHPGAIPRLIRFGRRISFARTRLASALDELVVLT